MRRPLGTLAHPELNYWGVPGSALIAVPQVPPSPDGADGEHVLHIPEDLAESPGTSQAVKKLSVDCGDLEPTSGLPALEYQVSRISSGETACQDSWGPASQP